MLSDLVGTFIDEQPDMQVVGSGLTRSAIADAVRNTGADVVIVELDDSSVPDDWHTLLYQFPYLGLVAISADVRDARLYELRPQLLASVMDLSPIGLVDAIRSTRGSRPHRGTPHRSPAWPVN